MRWKPYIGVEHIGGPEPHLCLDVAGDYNSLPGGGVGLIAYAARYLIIVVMLGYMASRVNIGGKIRACKYRLSYLIDIEGIGVDIEAHPPGLPQRGHGAGDI